MRTLFTWFTLVMVGALAAPVSAQTPLEASLTFVSEAGDWVGAGQTASYTLDTAAFSSQSSNNGGHLSLTVLGFNGDWWHLDFAAPAGMQLVPGAYDGATRYPFQSSNQPGLSFSGNGRGCNTLTGRFDVQEATFASTGYLERFRATFEQHCEGGEPALYGEVHIINPPPPPVLEVTLVIDPTARVERLSGRVYVTATFSCTTPTNLGIAATLDQRLTRSSRATATGYLTSPCSSAPTTATIEVIPFGNVPFGNGMAMLDLVANGYDYNYNHFVRVSFKQPLRLSPR